MRHLALSVLVLFSLRVCDSGGDSGSTTTPATSSPGARASSSAGVKASAEAGLVPRIGGSVVLVGGYVVELIVHATGRIEALVTTRAGEAIDPKAVKLAVIARGTADARPRVELSWSAPRARFVGQAGVELAPGPVEVSVDSAGTIAQATTADLALAFEPTFGGTVIVAGLHSLELAADTGGDIEAVLRDAAGAAVQADANIEATLAARGAAPKVRLAWDAPRARFIGHADAKVELVPGPLTVSIERGGTTAIGALAELGLRAKAAHGGRVVVVGQHSVELVAGASGEIQAFAYDARGTAHAAGDLGLWLELGGGKELKLVWDPATLSYKGSLKAKLDFAAQPVRVKLTAGGRADVGGVARLSADARLDAKAAARTGADLQAQAGTTAAAGAKVAAGAGAKTKAGAALDVTPPKVNVSVKAPSLKAGAGASAGAKAGAGAKASGKTGFSLGTK